MWVYRIIFRFQSLQQVARYAKPLSNFLKVFHEVKLVKFLLRKEIGLDLTVLILKQLNCRNLKNRALDAAVEETHQMIKLHF